MPSGDKERDMRIGIFGSDTGRRGFKEFCQDLGKSVGASRHTIMVASDRSTTADRWIADGVLALGHRRRARIKVFGRKGRPRPFDPTKSPYTGLADAFDHYPTRYARLSPTHLQMAREADVALVIGGSDSSYLVGLAAAHLGARLMPVAAFGGAGERLWQDFDSATDIKRPSAGTWISLPGNPATARERIAHEVSLLPKLMIVHGRDTDYRTVEELIADLGLAEPTVLRDDPGVGRTITEALEHAAAQADAAIAMFTPDDLGGPVLDGEGRPVSTTAEQLRARQNVNLEYGWFWGRLGRERILLLLKGALELGSDLHGLKYEAYEVSPTERELAIREFVLSLRDA